MLKRMELRHSTMPDGEDGVDPPDRPHLPDTVEPEVEPAVRFRVDGRLTALKVIAVVIFLAVAIFFRDDLARSLFAGLAGLVVGIYAIRDLSAPVRLAADADGVTVVDGFTGTRRLAWEQIQRVRVDRRRRLGTHSDLLEIDAGDSLHLLSSYDLGVAPCEAARTLAGLTRRRFDAAPLDQTGPVADQTGPVADQTGPVSDQDRPSPPGQPEGSSDR